MSHTPLTIGTIDLETAKLGICALPGGDNTLEADLGTIADWQASVVVTMTEQTEMEAVGSGDLGARLVDRGIEWHHLPVRDFGRLGEEGAARWDALATTLHLHLDQGRNVLVHCRGGIGRSGMVVMRLLVERGMPADTALSRLRAVRPGAVETDAQYSWAAGGANTA